jgi:pyruvate dehydrogenase E1 component alpha subunit
MEAAHCNGMDVLAVDTAAARAVDYVRQQRAPYFLELHTYRFRAHSMFDAELYRAKAEVEAWKERGPIHTFTQRLKAANMLTEAQFLALDQAAVEEVDAAVAFAEAGSWEPVEDLTKDVLTPRPSAALLTSGGPR